MRINLITSSLQDLGILRRQMACWPAAIQAGYRLKTPNEIANKIDLPRSVVRAGQFEEEC